MSGERSVIQRLHDICENAEFIQQTVSGVSAEEFFSDILYPAAVSLAFEIIGEASKYVPHDLRSAYPQIPWDDNIAFADLLGHEYHKVSSQDVWERAQSQIPALVDSVSAMIGDMEK